MATTRVAAQALYGMGTEGLADATCRAGTAWASGRPSGRTSACTWATSWPWPRWSASPRRAAPTRMRSRSCPRVRPQACWPELAVSGALERPWMVQRVPKERCSSTAAQCSCPAGHVHCTPAQVWGALLVTPSAGQLTDRPWCALHRPSIARSETLCVHASVAVVKTCGMHAAVNLETRVAALLKRLESTAHSRGPISRARRCPPPCQLSMQDGLVCPMTGWPCTSCISLCAPGAACSWHPPACSTLRCSSFRVCQHSQRSATNQQGAHTPGSLAHGRWGSRI